MHKVRRPESYPLSERPLSGDVQLHPPKTYPLIQIFAYQLSLYRVSTVLSPSMAVVWAGVCLTFCRKTHDRATRTRGNTRQTSH